MSKTLQHITIDGIKCYSPEVARDYANYPENGFELTDKNVKSSFWVNSRNRLFKSILKCYLLPSGKTNLFEIGCGTGDFIQQISEDSNFQITGSEIYLNGLLFAKKNLPNVEFVQFDITQGVIERQFNIITAFDVIEHIDDDSIALENIYEMLKKDGFLIISVPQHMLLWSKLDEIVKHKRRYSRQDLIDKLKAINFDIDYVTSFVFVLFPLMLISRLLDKVDTTQQSEDHEFEKRVKFPKFLNSILNSI